MKRNLLTLAVAVVVTLAPRVSVAEEMPSTLRTQIERHLIGAWTFSTKSEGETVTGNYTTQWVAGKHCVVITTVGSGPQGKVFGILAWQPDKGVLVHHGFISSGDYFRITYDKFDGNKWSGHVTAVVNGKRADGSDAHVVWQKDGFTYKDDAVSFEAKRKSRDERDK